MIRVSDVANELGIPYQGEEQFAGDAMGNGHSLDELLRRREAGCRNAHRAGRV